MNGKKATLNLIQDVDSGRIRVDSFGCPEPHKLPMDKKFGIPKLLMQLMNKLLNKKFVMIKKLVYSVYLQKK